MGTLSTADMVNIKHPVVGFLMFSLSPPLSLSLKIHRYFEAKYLYFLGFRILPNYCSLVTPQHKCLKHSAAKKQHALDIAEQLRPFFKTSGSTSIFDLIFEWRHCLKDTGSLTNEKRWGSIDMFILLNNCLFVCFLFCFLFLFLLLFLFLFLFCFVFCRWMSTKDGLTIAPAVWWPWQNLKAF